MVKKTHKNTKKRTRKYKKNKKSKKRNDKIYTFKCNRSDILNQLLIKNKFIEGKDHVDFSLWDTLGEKYSITSKVKCIERKFSNDIDNKKTFYIHIVKYGMIKDTPKTYINITDIKREIFDGRLFFLKNIYGAGGSKVYTVKTLENMYKNIIGIPNNYILQEEVPNMYLHKDKYKTTIRNYVLICEKGIYFYNEGYVYIYKKEYTKNNLDNSIHNAVFTACDYEKLSEQYYYKTILPELHRITSQLFHNYFKNTTLYNRYLIIGIDFIIDKKYKPYIIEINGYPNLSMSCGFGGVKVNMLHDFVNFYVLPKIKGGKSKRGGGWIKI